MKRYFAKHSLINLALILIIIPLACHKNHSTMPGKEITLRLEPSTGNPRNSEGDFVRLNDGRILFVYTHFTSGSADHASAYLAGRYSKDNGKTWSCEDVLILAKEGQMNIMSVSLLGLQNGQIALFYLRKNSDSDCIPYLRISTDEAQTWSAPIRCIADSGYYVMNNDRAVLLKTNRIILPVALHNTPSSQWSNVGRIWCYFSDDNGHSWAKSQQVANPDKIVLQEPGVVALKDGRLMLFCRTTAGVQYFSFSDDNGETWSTIEPGNIKSPCSPASIERIPSTGDLLLVWNNNYEPESSNGGRRTPFNLAISKDEGMSWEKVKTIESDPMGWYCYTAIEFTDEHVLLGHCAGDRRKHNGLARTHITRLNLDWIYADATPEPYVAKDSAGVVVLASPAKDAEIHYTMDGNLPSMSSPVYLQPIQVSMATDLYLQAFHAKMTPSALISVRVGTDVLQDAVKVRERLAPGLIFFYFEGECENIADIGKLSAQKYGVAPRISLAERERDHNFALRFDGFINIPEDGIYTFYLLSNDGSALYLDGKLLVNNDGSHGEYEVSKALGLRGGLHQIDIRFFQKGGGQAIQASWQGPGFDKTEISPKVLLHANSLVRPLTPPR